MITSGGHVSSYADGSTAYCVHAFTSNALFTVAQGMEVDIAVVGGGGGAGYYINSHGGGGGAGGMCELSGDSIPAGHYAVTVGSGGQAVSDGSMNGGVAYNGGDSSFAGIVAKGGGGGASYAGWASMKGANGGSGGGGSEFSYGGESLQTDNGGATCYGNKGGQDQTPSSSGSCVQSPCVSNGNTGTGGGGAGGAGSGGSGSATTVGGVGSGNTWLTGTEINYALGGDTDSNTINGSPGPTPANTGSGGGGCRGHSSCAGSCSGGWTCVGYAGADGIVAIGYTSISGSCS